MKRKRELKIPIASLARGLENDGNTCFVNAIVVLLAIGRDTSNAIIALTRATSLPPISISLSPSPSLSSPL
jgi:hypothetical protein